MESAFAIAALWLLVAAVIASALMPTAIATYAFLPRHLLQGGPALDKEMTVLDRESDGEPATE